MIRIRNQKLPGLTYVWLVQFTWAMGVCVGAQDTSSILKVDSSGRTLEAQTDSILRLAKTSIDSFLQMDARIQAELPKADKVRADSLFFTYHRFVEKRLLPDVGGTYNRLINWFPNHKGQMKSDHYGSKPLSPFETDLVASLYRGGIRMEELAIGSRVVYLVDFRYRDRFKRYVSPDLGEAIEISERERARPLDGNGTCGIFLSIPEIGEFIAACESFLLRFPSSKYAPRVESLRSMYLNAFLFQSENHDIPLGTKDKYDQLPIYQNYIRKYPGRESTAFVKRFLALRKANGYREPEKMNDSLRIPSGEYPLPGFE